jgi:hypothetical protein
LLKLKQEAPAINNLDECGNLFATITTTASRHHHYYLILALAVIEGLCFIILHLERKRSRKRTW